MTAPSSQPPNKLGQQLLDAGRDESAAESSLQRAHQLVDSLPAAEGPRSVQRAPGRKRWAPLALAAAAMLVGATLFVMVTQTSESEPKAKTPAATALPSPLPPAAATAVEIAQPQPTPSTAPSASASARLNAVAERAPRKSPPAAAKPPPPEPAASPPATSKCNCAPNDLMCNMHCAEK